MDAVSAIVTRDPDPEPLLEASARADVEIGLHLMVEEAPLDQQLAAFTRLFARSPAYLDGHHHCHAADPRLSGVVARRAAAIGVPVRSVDSSHRQLLRGLGVMTADRLVGRLDESEPPVPDEIGALLTGARFPGVTEWMVHPGHAGGPSSYDAGRERDLEELLLLGDRAAWHGRGVVRAPFSRAGLR
ncbi:MAG TPA: ChbG/HpnK family deacetylase [Solirubrobacterales bacterium]|nr:ChbG/HpnK family deacetylase [Solirubrobacterales bacterium]